MARYPFDIFPTAKLPLWGLRRVFLDAVAQQVPEVLTSLHEDVLPLWEGLARLEEKELSKPGEPILGLPETIAVKIPEEEPPESVPGTLGLWRSIQESMGHLYPEADPLKQALLHWAAGFNLTDEWVLDIAVGTVATWHASGEDASQLTWVFPDLLSQTPLSQQERRLDIVHPGWDAPFEPWEAFKKAIRKRFDQELKAYKARVEKRLTSRGWGLPLKRRRGKHFDWLALYQVKSWSPGKIANWESSKNDRPNESTVVKAVHETAKLIGLTLRPSRKGKTKPKT